LAKLLLLASTSRMLQLGHADETMSRSSAISSAQPRLGAGYEPWTPFWLTFLKQPLLVLHSDNPYSLR
jgi:hypothetical protein